MEEDKKGQSVPANMEEAVSEFIKAREERIESRRARIAEKVAAAYGPILRFDHVVYLIF
jgi:hypothetical protein